MTAAEYLRVATMCLAFPNIALLVMLAWHLSNDFESKYVPVFRAAAIFYVGTAVVLAAISYRQIELFSAPLSPATPFLLVGNAVIMYGLIGLTRLLPKRTW